RRACPWRPTLTRPPFTSISPAYFGFGSVKLSLLLSLICLGDCEKGGCNGGEYASPDRGSHGDRDGKHQGDGGCEHDTRRSRRDPRWKRRDPRLPRQSW